VSHGLNGDLGFSEKERRENIRRVGHVDRLMYDGGFTVTCSFISPRMHGDLYRFSRASKDKTCVFFIAALLFMDTFMKEPVL
jgi:adenylylsulfate kinase-like enzyme